MLNHHTSILLRDMGTLSPGDFNFGRWFCIRKGLIWSNVWSLFQIKPFWPPGLDLASRLICRSAGFMKVCYFIIQPAFGIQTWEEWLIQFHCFWLFLIYFFPLHWQIVCTSFLRFFSWWTPLHDFINVVLVLTSKWLLYVMIYIFKSFLHPLHFFVLLGFAFTFWFFFFLVVILFWMFFSGSFLRHFSWNFFPITLAFSLSFRWIFFNYVNWVFKLFCISLTSTCIKLNM